MIKLKHFISKTISLLTVCSIMLLSANTTVFAEDAAYNEEFIAEAAVNSDYEEEFLEDKDERNPSVSYEAPIVAEAESNASEPADSENEASMSDAEIGTFTDAGEIIDASGKCGDNLTWSLSGGKLVISGSGKMYDFTSDSSPEWFTSSSSITSVVINSGVTSIGNMAFYDCTMLESVTIPSTVSEIGRISFAECKNLKSISLPDKVTVIPYAAFANCQSLSSITANKVTKIDDYAFQSVGIKTFKIVKSVNDISFLAFTNSNIEAFSVEAGNNTFSSKDGVLFTDNGKTLFAYPVEKSGASYTVPSEVTKIGDGAFFYNKYLTDINMGNKVTYLGRSSFSFSAVTSIVIPDSVTEADDFTFYGCNNLTSVKFGKGLKKTSYEMFEECSALTDIDFGTGLNELDARTFAACESLKEVNLPACIKKIGNGCFGNCYYLEKFSSKGLKDIPFQTFLNDRRLTTVSLNEGVTDIYRLAFGGCSGLLKITLPKSTKYVHSMGFERCTVITCKNPLMDPFGRNGYRYLEPVSVSGERNYTYAYEVLKLVNKERASAGLTPLVMNESLLESSMTRAAECSLLFSHTRPDSSICFDLNPLMYAENIAYGQNTPEYVMNSWMNSQGHRANILNKDLKTIGIGCFVIDGKYYWAQCFGNGDDTYSVSSPVNKKVTEKINIATEKFDEASTSTGIIWGELEEYEYRLVLEVDGAIKEGESKKANVYVVNPGNNAYTKIDNNSLKWSSDNTSVATVDKNGRITCVGAGNATITAKTKDSGYVLKYTIYTAAPSVSYRTHVQTYGWQGWKSDGEMSGTSGQAKRLEGIEIKLDNKKLGIRYKTHVQSYGWQDWRYDGEMSGTSGEAKRLEAICIELTGADKDKFDVYYRVHAQTYGWLGWAKNGAPAGTAAQAKRLEGIEIRILPKGQTPDGMVGYSYIELGKASTNGDHNGMVNYMTHVQSYGDQNYVFDGSVSGTFGEAKRLEGIRINVNNNISGVSGGIRYKTHVQTYGWLGWSGDGEFNGTHGEAKRLEAIQIELTGDMANKYDIYYRVHAQSYGWLGWAKNGQESGTSGLGKRLEGIQIVILPKGSAAPGILPGNTYVPYIMR